MWRGWPMTDDGQLGLRALACKHWRHKDGTLDTQGARLHEDSWHQPRGWDPREFARLGCVHIPDLTDAATLGCLRELVREAWGESIVAVPLAFGLQWHACRERNPGSGLVVGSGATEAEALVAALEAAP